MSPERSLPERIFQEGEEVSTRDSQRDEEISRLLHAEHLDRLLAVPRISKKAKRKLRRQRAKLKVESLEPLTAGEEATILRASGNFGGVQGGSDD